MLVSFFNRLIDFAIVQVRPDMSRTAAKRRDRKQRLKKKIEKDLETANQESREARRKTLGQCAGETELYLSW